MAQHSDTSAFPYTGTMTETGLSKREFFTALALQGLLAAAGPQAPSQIPELAITAVEFADHTLQILEQS